MAFLIAGFILMRRKTCAGTGPALKVSGNVQMGSNAFPDKMFAMVESKCPTMTSMNVQTVLKRKTVTSIPAWQVI